MSVSFFMWCSLILCFCAQGYLAYLFFWKKDRDEHWSGPPFHTIRNGVRIMWPTMVWMLVCVPLKSLVSISIPARMVFLRDEKVVAVFERPTALWYWDDVVDQLVDTDFHQYQEAAHRVKVPLGFESSPGGDNVTLMVLTNITLQDFLLYHQTFGHESPEEIVRSIMREAASQCVLPRSLSTGAKERIIRSHMESSFEAAFSDTGLHLLTIEIDLRQESEPGRTPRDRGVIAEKMFTSGQRALG